MSETPPVSCPNCGAAMNDGDRYCEACGTDLVAAAPARKPQARDHTERDAGWAAGVCDRGIHHERNEDALFLSATGPGRLAVVVCDGVSSSLKADVASQTAADVVGAGLVDLLSRDPPAIGEAMVSAAMNEAVVAAQAAVVAIPWTGVDEMSAPACTLVAGTVIDGQVTLCSIGDSRAYWLGPDGARQLTTDDSWAGEQVASGAMTEDEAMADPRAHAITRWLGTDAPTDPPQLSTFCPSTPGWLLICSDGLWNYAATPEHLDQLIATQPPDTTPLALARALTNFALSAGGHDNITVVVADLAPAATKGTP